MTTTGTPDDPTSITAHCEAIANDHAHGLHDGYDNGDCCTYRGCDDAYWLLAQRDERRGTR